MKQNDVKISVIVPVYNVEQYLEKCLTSLVKQTLKEIEIIVVNDGTKDNSQKIIDKFVKKYKNVKSFIKENGGLSSARNYGLKYANGEYISFIDSDDFIDLKMLKSMYQSAIENGWDIVVCDSINVYENRKTSYRKSNFHYSDDNVKNYIISPPMACTRIYRKNIFDNQKFTENIFYEDLNLVPSLVNLTKKIGFVEKGYYYYLQRSNSIMKQLDFNIRLLDIFKVLDNNYKILNDEYPLEIEYLYITHLLRSGTLRFLNYNNSTEYLNKINKIFNERFPKWYKNEYYKKSSIKLKLICFLAIKKQYKILRIIKKITKM